jgi:trehalose 6-phosphate synthase
MCHHSLMSYSVDKLPQSKSTKINSDLGNTAMPSLASGPRLHKLCQELLAHRNFIIASNRGPIDYRLNEAGKPQGRRGSGGVVTALSALAQYMDLTWVASAMGEGDRGAAEMAQGRRFKAPLPGHNLYIRFVASAGSTYYKFYSVFCNPLLWFLQHCMWNSSHTPNIDARVHDAWQNGYKAVNQAIAEAVIAEASESELPPLVMLHDYHLYLAPAYIREQIPNAIIHHFTHIPWPGPQYWQLLPREMCREICGGLCASDIVGMQTDRDVHNFLHTCKVFIEGAEIDYTSCTIILNGHHVKVKSYPVSVDVANLHKTVRSSMLREYDKKLQPFFGKKTIVRVDRMEPSKNIVRGFRAFDTLLQRYPDLQGKVSFLAFLVPSRTRIKQYRRYAEEVNEAIEAINTKYGNDDWQPITVFYENNYAQALAALCLYDVLLVNPVVDGMNLVAKEGPTVNSRDGVLVLSESAGACEQLRENALPITPCDLEGTVEAIYRALMMSPEERKQRATALKKSIEEEDIAWWLYQQLSDVTALALEQLQQTT